MEEKFYTKYDNVCIFYLSLEILKYLELEKEHVYIDVYYDVITNIYEDYKLHDDANVSLLDSVNNYIESNKDMILEKLNGAFDGAF